MFMIMVNIIITITLITIIIDFKWFINTRQSEIGSSKCKRVRGIVKMEGRNYLNSESR